MEVFLITRLKILLLMTQLSVAKLFNNTALKSIRIGKTKINKRPSNKVIYYKVLGSQVPTPAKAGMISRQGSGVGTGDACGYHPLTAGVLSSVLGNPRFPAAPQAASSWAPLQDTALSEESPEYKTDFGHSAVQHFSHTASQNSSHLPEERTCITETAETPAPRGGFQGHRTQQG